MSTIRLVLIAFLNTVPHARADDALSKADLFLAGEGGYSTYRIPGIVATPRGTVLVVAEARKSDRSDWGAIDIVSRRSTDGGRDWEPPRALVHLDGPVLKNPAAVAQGLGKPGEVTINNPTAIVDPKDGAILVLYCVEYERCYVIRSDDDGATFGPPVEITSTFEAFRPEYDWKVLATGPGHGIVLSNGRLVVPVWLSTGAGGHAHRPSAVATIVSDDQGRTWRRGEIVAAHPEPANPSESMAVELADGRVMLNIRHESPNRRRAVSISPDGSSRWAAIRFDQALPDPVCMASLVRAGPGVLLFSNPHNPAGRERKNLTIKLSEDDGRTWPFSRILESGASGYSDLAVGADGTIYCLYERGGIGGNATRPRSLCLTRFDLGWVKGRPAP